MKCLILTNCLIRFVALFLYYRKFFVVLLLEIIVSGCTNNRFDSGGVGGCMGDGEVCCTIDRFDFVVVGGRRGDSGHFIIEKLKGVGAELSVASDRRI